MNIVALYISIQNVVYSPVGRAGLQSLTFTWNLIPFQKNKSGNIDRNKYRLRLGFSQFKLCRKKRITIFTCLQ